MKPILKTTAHTVFALVVIGLLSGCASSPKSKFYYFRPTYDFQHAIPRDLTDTAYSVGFMPVSLPPYLDRPQIATRVGENEMEFNEFHRWAASIQENILLVLTHDLSALLPEAYVDAFPWSERMQFDYQIQLELLTMSGEFGKNVELVAQWTLYRGSNSLNMVTRQTAAYQAPLGKNHDYAVLVQTYSKLIAELSKDVAEAIKANIKKEPFPEGKKSGSEK